MASKYAGDDDDNAMVGSSTLIPNWANVSFSEIVVGDRIGGGGVGVIYSGQWRSKPVALKTLFDPRISNDLKQEFMDELLVMSKVEHSNIVKFLGACVTPPNLCFIMELCDTSLFHMLHVEKCAFSLEESLQAAIDVASAMEYLHSLSPAIIHRDLKTHNVLRSFEGQYKLCDFGLVKNRVTMAGTPAYMAPELLQGRSYNKSVDVYAFGVLLWELFTASVPFGRMELSDLRDHVISGKRPPMPAYGMPNRCSRLIVQCWDQRPDNRPTFTEVVDELLELEKSAPEAKHTENLKDDILEGLMSSTARK